MSAGVKPDNIDNFYIFTIECQRESPPGVTYRHRP